MCASSPGEWPLMQVMNLYINPKLYDDDVESFCRIFCFLQEYERFIQSLEERGASDKHNSLEICYL